VAGYTHPEVIVSTEWVTNHLADADVRVVEVDVDTKAYSEGHVPGAIACVEHTTVRYGSPRHSVEIPDGTIVIVVGGKPHYHRDHLR